MPNPKLLTPREAATTLGISFPTIKQWIYKGKLKTVKTPGGHHRVPDSELDRYLSRKTNKSPIAGRRTCGAWRSCSASSPPTALRAC